MDDLANLLQRDKVIDTITRLFIATDNRDWPAVRACFTTQVVFDMSSLTGRPPELLDADAIVDAWNRGLRPLAAVHHQAGNFRALVDGDSARATCYAIAFHYRVHPSGQNTRTFVGSYDFRLIDDGEWRISHFRFNSKFVDGNLELEKD